MPFFCVYSLTTNLALKVCIDLFVMYFLLNTRLYLIDFDPKGKFTRIQILLNNIESVSSSIASFQKMHLLKPLPHYMPQDYLQYLINGYFIEHSGSITFYKEDHRLGRNKIRTQILFFLSLILLQSLGKYYFSFFNYFHYQIC